MTTGRTWPAVLALAAGAALVPAVAAAGAPATTQAAAGAPEAAADRRADLAAFDRILARQEAAWAAEDGAAFAATFAEDADLVTFNGDYLVGRNGIATGMQHAFDTYIPPSRIVRLGQHVRFVERDLAVVVRTSCIIDAGQDACRSGSHSRNTNVLHKQNGRWLQTSFQNTRIDPLP